MPHVSLSQLTRQPKLRVRIISAVRQITLQGRGSILAWTRLGPATAQQAIQHGQKQTLPLPITVVLLQANQQTYLFASAASGQQVTGKQLHFEPVHPDTFQISHTTYPGQLTLHLTSNGKAIDAVNHVLIEQYLPGVLDGELYRNWHPVTFQAQAIAARSYAIAQLPRRQHRLFDLVASQASQMYHGRSSNKRALSAVQQTLGMVLVYNQQIVPAYYSSSSGGAGQDAYKIFPNEQDIPPLRGRRHGQWGKASRYFDWGPIIRPAKHLAGRLIAWGQRANHPLQKMGQLKTVQMTEPNAAGRPAVVIITDHRDKHFKLNPEQFRRACNRSVPGLPKLGPKLRLPSSFVLVRLDAASGQVHFMQGHGFGHGVGMDQYAAQAMAKEGRSAKAILGFFYPQAKLVQAYGPGGQRSSSQRSPLR